MMELKQKERYQEMDIILHDIKIGEAEVDLDSHMLSRLCIYEPYQNKGLGQRAVNLLINQFEIDNLWVRSDNERAIHVYEKCGFKRSKETMFEMKRGDENGNNTDD